MSLRLFLTIAFRISTLINVTGLLFCILKDGGCFFTDESLTMLDEWHVESPVNWVWVPFGPATCSDGDIKDIIHCYRCGVDSTIYLWYALKNIYIFTHSFIMLTGDQSWEFAGEDCFVFVFQLKLDESGIFVLMFIVFVKINMHNFIQQILPLKFSCVFAAVCSK